MDVTGNTTVLMVYRAVQINRRLCQITPYIVFTYSKRAPNHTKKEITELSPLYKNIMPKTRYVTL
jgi:hypothetical protein